MPQINWRSLAAVLLALAATRSSLAAGPDVRSLLPAGVRRGATVEVAAGGKFDKWPVQAWVDRSGVTVTAGSEKGKLSVSASDDAAAGLCWIRLYDADGAGSPMPFVVGTLPEVIEQEPNDSPAQAQSLGASPVVVNGRLGKGGDVDVFAFHADKGQTVVASLAAHEVLGSPVDAVMQIALRGSSVLAFNHDFHGLDPQIVFTAPEAADYSVRLFGFPSAPNSSIGFAGGDAYVYRLTVSAAPFVDHAWPLAVQSGGERIVELFGWNVPDELKTATIDADDGERVSVCDPRLGNVATLIVEPHSAIVESDATAPQTIELPTSISGRIDAAEVDAYTFVGTKGEPLEFRLLSRELGYPLDGVLEVTDESGKSLARVDDVGGTFDPVLAFAPPADGTYRIAVSDLTGAGGFRHVYVLRGTRVQPEFDIAASAHAHEVTAGKTAEVTLTVNRRNGFSEPIALKVTGLPEGVTASPAESTPTGDAAKTVKLTLTAAEGAAAHSGVIRIAGESTGVSKLARPATAAVSIPGATTRDIWLTVK